MTFWNSKNVPGHPCTRSKGIAVEARTRAGSWMKWTFRSLIDVV
jgi:hypothetical protein